MKTLELREMENLSGGGNQCSNGQMNMIVASAGIALIGIGAAAVTGGAAILPMAGLFMSIANAGNCNYGWW